MKNLEHVLVLKDYNRMNHQELKDEEASLVDEYRNARTHGNHIAMRACITELTTVRNIILSL